MTEGQPCLLLALEQVMAICCEQDNLALLAQLPQIVIRSVMWNVQALKDLNFELETLPLPSMHWTSTGVVTLEVAFDIVISHDTSYHATLLALPSGMVVWWLI